MTHVDELHLLAQPLVDHVEAGKLAKRVCDLIPELRRLHAEVEAARDRIDTLEGRLEESEDACRAALDARHEKSEALDAARAELERLKEDHDGERTSDHE